MLSILLDTSRTHIVVDLVMQLGIGQINWESIHLDNN